MRLTYTAEALSELAEAVSYYQSCRKGLGRKFYQRVEAGTKTSYAIPKLGAAWAILGGASC